MKTIFFDLVMISLLIGAIIFCYRLNNRIKTLREMGTELSPFMNNLSNYLGRISQSVDKLKQISDLGNKSLNENIPIAINLKDDFDLLLEYSDKMANRLDELIAKARDVDQKLQQTLRISEGARSNESRIDPSLKKSPERSQPERNQHEMSMHYSKQTHAKNHLMNENLPLSKPLQSPPSNYSPLNPNRNDSGYLNPSQLNQQIYTEVEEKERKQNNPIGRGIMEKLRGLR